MEKEPSELSPLEKTKHLFDQIAVFTSVEKLFFLQEEPSPGDLDLQTGLVHPPLGQGANKLFGTLDEQTVVILVDLDCLD